MMEPDSWGEYRRLVLSELERVNNRAAAIESKVDALRMEMVGIKAKATAYGGIAGIVFGAIVAGVAKAVFR